LRAVPAPPRIFQRAFVALYIIRLDSVLKACKEGVVIQCSEHMFSLVLLII